MQTKWKIVPVEPTRAMLDAGMFAPTKRLSPSDAVEKVYKAMLFVSPPCADLETVKAALEKSDKALTDARKYMGRGYLGDSVELHERLAETERLVFSALAALGRVRGE